MYQNFLYDTRKTNLIVAKNVRAMIYCPTKISWPQVSGVRCQVSGVRCQVSGVQVSGVRCPGVRCQVLGVRCQVLGVDTQVSPRCQVSVMGLGFRVGLGLGLG